MNPESIVELLEPLRVPGPVSWWPLAPGWWFLLALLGLAISVGTFYGWRYYQRRAPIREARQRLYRLRDDAALTNSEKAAHLGQLQRQLAIAIAGRSGCSPLTGAAWADYLNALAKSDLGFFTAEMTNLAYRPTVDSDDCLAAINATDSWLRDVRPCQ